jgi:2-polyprenyl-6-methoxyphenol hydroxylase-like FAD-dependent oxidoreductase
VRTLRSLGVDIGALAARQGRGFAIFGDDGGDPICLPYDDEVSIARVHDELVQHLREHAVGLAHVTYLPQHVFARLEGQTIELEDREHSRRVSVRADRIIGADGRASKVRAALQGPTESQKLSYLAGLELRDASLPFEGLGHVFLGGPGPALLYRIDERRIRACLDIPLGTPNAARRPDAVYQAFRGALPPELEPALRVHPLSGVGITLGVLDADAAARSASLPAYRSERDAHVAELLATVLYSVFSRNDASATRVRHGLLRMLRKSPSERRRTMRLLTSDDRAGTSFADAFLRASGHVVLTGAERSAARRQSWLEGVRQLRKDAGWLEWPLRACMPSTESSARSAPW